MSTELIDEIQAIETSAIEQIATVDSVERLSDGHAATGAGPVLVLVDVADPGNAGTLLRSAEAAGATEVWSVAGSVDLFAPKVVRASAGALFHVPVLADIDADTAIGELRAAGIAVLGTRARDGVPYDRADLAGPSALMLGNEAHGLDEK